MRKFLKVLVRISALGIIALAVTGSDCEQPKISSITPSSGRTGTIVEVVFSEGSLTGQIRFDGSLVKTHSASNIGLGNKLRFTIPYGATLGSKTVQVVSGGKTSLPVSFNVTGTAAVPTPVLEGYEIADSNGREITVFGRNFTTLSQVFINGNEVESYYGNSSPIRELPFEFVDNAIICTPKTNLNPGSQYSVQVKNPNNKNSNILSVRVPTRKCKMEFDAISGKSVPDYYVWQNNTLNTFRRTYNQCGWLINLIHDDLNIPDPNPGTGFTTADLYSFWKAHADVPTTGYYMHGAFVGDDTNGYLGIMYMNTGRIPSLPSANYRQGFAAFWDNFASTGDRRQKYFRTTLHESGHGFNLLHEDKSGNQTVMTQTGSLVVGWHCFFSTLSCTHLRSHSITAVAPGGDPFGSSRSCNHLH